MELVNQPGERTVFVNTQSTRSEYLHHAKTAEATEWL